MPVKNRPLAASFVAAAMLGFAAIGGATAEEPSAEKTPIRQSANQVKNIVIEGTGSYRPSAQELADLERYTAVHGDDGRLDALKGQLPFADLLEELEKTLPDSYVTGGLRPTDLADAWILFTTSPPEEALELIRELPIDVEIRIGHAASGAEIQDAADAATAALAEAGGDEVRVSSHITPEFDAIELQYATVDGARNTRTLEDRLSRSALGAVTAKSADRELPVPVTVKHEPELKMEQYGATFGGGQLRLTNGAPDCTSGFNGIRNGVRGLITARHCADRLRFGNNVGWIQFVGVAGGTPNGNSIDLQFHRAINGTTTPPRFRATNMNDFRTVTRRSNPPAGNWVCTWGMTTGYWCSTVYSTNVCYTPLGLTYCGLLATTGDQGARGDSGGPLFYASTAHGFVSGAKYMNGRMRALFTKQSMASTYMNTTIRTG